MNRTLLINGACVVLVVLLHEYLYHYDVAYYVKISSPILSDWDIYNKFSDVWAVVILTGVIASLFLPHNLSQIWNNYAILPFHALLLSNGYFGLVMKAYFSSYSINQISIDIIPIFVVAVLLLLERYKVEQIVKLHVIVFCSVLPLGLQYASIAAEHLPFAK